jgi:hypothetical protein
LLHSRSVACRQTMSRIAAAHRSWRRGSALSR